MAGILSAPLENHRKLLHYSAAVTPVECFSYCPHVGTAPTRAAVRSPLVVRAY